MKKLMCLLALLTACFNADAREWYVHGITPVYPEATVENPDVCLSGISGQISCFEDEEKISEFPYTVPRGHHLVIEQVSVSVWNRMRVGIRLWIGQAPYELCKDVFWYISPDGSFYLPGMRISIPEGRTIHMQLENKTPLRCFSNHDAIVGWHLRGEIKKNN